MPIELDMSIIIICSVASLIVALVGMGCGFVIGRTYTLSNEPRKLQHDRERTLTALLKLLDSTQQLNNEVDSHNNELEMAKNDLEHMDTSESDIRDLQDRVVSNIAKVVESNRKLENELVVSHYEMERQAEELDRTRKEARTDSLCHVGNRKAFDEAFQFMISRYERHSIPFGLMLIDIDHFKRINDTFGHQAGDSVLVSIGTALKECVRPEDVVCRLGGDEFAILLHQLTSENAASVGARIRQTVEKYDFSVGSKGQSTVVTMSMGLAAVQPEDGLEILYERADSALYKSKELGRNRLYTILNDNEGISGSGSLSQEEEILEEAKNLSYEDIKASFLQQDPKNTIQ